MATISLENLVFFAYHGCFAEEALVGTHFRVDLSFDVDTQRAELSDNIADTVSYLDVYQTVKSEMAQPSHLLEHLARRIRNGLENQYPSIQNLHVKVCKLNPPLGGQVGATCISL